MTRADSAAIGYLSPARIGLSPGLRPLATLIGSAAQASIASVNPGWFQGAQQPQTISVELNGPVNSVTVSGGGAILCSGTYGTLIGYDKNGVVLGTTPLDLIDPSDCGGDNITFGAAATLTVSAGVIARFQITPMAPLLFYTGARGSASYSVSLGVYAVADYPPIPTFSAACNGSTFDCTLDATGSTDDFGISSFGWNLGKSPGGTATGSQVTTNYFHAGWRTATLKLTDNAGQTSRLTKEFGVGVGLPPGQPPVINLVITCVQLTCTFNDNAVGQTQALYRTWDFGDNTFATSVTSPTHTYPYSYPFFLTEKVADAAGAYTVAFRVVDVIGPPTDAPPVPSFTFNCVGQSYPHQCAFDASGSTDDVGIVSYKWDWGNGRSETKVGKTTRNTWAAAGSYQVTLTVTDTKAQSTSLTTSVLVP